MNLFAHKHLKNAYIFGGLIAVTVAGYFAYKALNHKDLLDAPMRNALDQASKVSIYSQYVETETTFPQRALKISGTYYVNNAKKEFVSHSTTTLFIDGDPKGHIFTHDDITIQDNVFFKVDTRDTLLKKAIKASPDWAYFKNGTIPSDKQDIAIVGPLQDNLSILSNNGAYITLIKKVGLVSWGSEQLLRYTFGLSKKASDVPDGPLNAILERLSSKGTVDLWIDPKTFEVRYMLFQNAPYFSTTTITGLNTPLPVAAPIDVSSQ